MEVIFLLESIRIVRLVDLSLIVSPDFKEKSKFAIFNVYSVP